MTLSTAYAAQLGSTVLSGLTNLDAQTNPEVDNEVGIGSIYPQFVVIRSINPKVLFNSRAAQATLSQTGSTGADITDANPFKATFARLAANGQPDNTAIHRTYTATRGLLLPKRLSCQHRQDARIDVETLLWSADGVAAPMVIADTGALPTVPRDNIRHTLQSATIGGVSFGCLESVDVDFGNNARTRGCSSNQYDSDMIQAGVQPVITLVGLNADVFKSAGIPLDGKPVQHVDTSIVLRKYSEDGTGFVAAATAEHIELTASGLAVVVNHSGSGANESTVNVRVTCDWDGTNAPIGIDTAYAY